MKNSRYIDLKNISPLFWLITIHLIILAYWLKRDHSFLINDAFDHYIVTLLKNNSFKNLFVVSDYIIENTTYFIRWHGAFPNYISAALLLALPVSQDMAVFVHSLIFFSAALVFTYLIASLFLSKKTALFSAFIFSLLPVTGQHLRIFMSDMPLTALITGCLYFLIKTHRDPTTKNYLLFIMMAIFSFFTKANTILFLLFPSLVFLFYNRKKNSAQIALSLVFIFFLATAISKPAIFSRLFSCLWLPIFKGVIYPGLIDTIVLSFFDFLITTFYNFFNYAISSLVFLFSLAGVIVLLFQKKYKLCLLLTGFILTPVFIMGLLLFIEYDIRYLMPIFPFICMLSAVPLTAPKNKYWQYFSVFLLLGFLLVNNYNLFFSNKPNFLSKLPLNYKIVNTLNRNNIKKCFKLSPYKFYEQTPVLHSSAKDLYIFTQKYQNLFRSSLTMHLQKEPNPLYQYTTKILSKLNKTQKASLIFIGENRLIYTLLLERVTLLNLPLELIKYENYDQIKQLDITAELNNADYIFLTDTNDEVFTDSALIKKDYIGKTNTIRKNIQKIIPAYTLIYENKDSLSQIKLFHKN